MGMRIKGLQKAINGCDRFVDQLRDAAQETADDSIEVVEKESQIQVPKKTGALAKSKVIIKRKKTGNRRTTVIRYGDSALNSNGESYAAAVHEILKASHASPTKAKFVEDPLVQSIPTYKVIGAKACKKRVKRAFR